MKGMILAAGFGKRLGVLTQNTPKCLLQVDGEPILAWVIKRLKNAGVTQLVINLHYLPEQVIDFVVSKKSFGIEIIFSHEPTILGTGGALKAQQEFFKDEQAFIVHNADIWSDIDLESLIANHLANRASATLAVLESETQRPLIFDSTWKLIGWQDKQKGLSEGEVSTAAHAAEFTGIQVLGAKIFDHMQNFSGEFSSIPVYLAAAAKGEVVLGQPFTDVQWIDIGTAQSLEQLNQKLS